MLLIRLELQNSIFICYIRVRQKQLIQILYTEHIKKEPCRVGDEWFLIRYLTIDKQLYIGTKKCTRIQKMKYLLTVVMNVYCIPYY